MQQKYFYVPFAGNGDLTSGGIPNANDPNGYVSYNQGFTFDYQRVLGTDAAAKNIQRITWNSVLNDATVNIQNYQQYGTPEFITSADNNGNTFAYDASAIIRYRAGVGAPWGVFLSRVANNTATPAEGINWSVVQTFAATVNYVASQLSFFNNSAHTWPQLQQFSGGASVPTQIAIDNSVNAASTAFVQSRLIALLAGYNVWNGAQQFNGGAIINNATAGNQPVALGQFILTSVNVPGGVMSSLRLPNGMLIQFGTVAGSSVANSTATYSWPVQFAGYSAILLTPQNNNNTPVSSWIEFANINGFSFGCSLGGISTSFIAIGN